MPLVTLYFQLHQPFRLHPDGDKFFWDEKNEDCFRKASDNCYLPAISMFEHLIRKNSKFKIALSMSGTFLEQGERYRCDVIEALYNLLQAGRENNQVEFLEETYYHSLTGFFDDPAKQEFRDQVSHHRDKIRSLFGVMPKTFGNTALLYNNEIGSVVADMGYSAILYRNGNGLIPMILNIPGDSRIFSATGSDLKILPVDKNFSDQIAFRFIRQPFSPEKFVSKIARVRRDTITLGYNLRQMGGTIRDRFLKFWNGFAAAITEQKGISMANPTEVAERSQGLRCTPLDMRGSDIHLRTNVVKDAVSSFGSIKQTQYRLFKDIEKLETYARRAGGDLLSKWRHLTSADHILFERGGMRRGNSISADHDDFINEVMYRTYIVTRKIDQLESSLKRFDILKKSNNRTAVLLITPETGSLPEEMGTLARYIHGKSGGLGEVVTALCEGLTERGIECHIATMSLKKRFQREANVDELKWREIRHNIEPEKIHLVSSAVFADLPSPYAGDPRLNAAEFQKQIVNHIIRSVRARYGGKLIVHSHDWMAGGVITAYAKSRGCPILHTVHNSFTGHVPLDMMIGVNVDQLNDNIYYTEDYGRHCIDCQATAIKNATIINFVGKRFLEEVISDYFSDRGVIPESVRQEVREKYRCGSARTIINCPSFGLYPETCRHLVRKYGPDDAVVAKRENLVEFQKRTGLVVNPDAVLFYWPSRLDPSQKGIELLEDIALKFVIDHGDAQIGIVADGVGGDRTHEDILGRIAWASGGKITYRDFSEELSLLGYAAASDVFGASLYEPCGQIDQIGNLFGATATNRDTGGYHDKIRELRLKADGAPQDVGNGFLFKDYDPGGLLFGLEKSINFHRRSLTVRGGQIERIMRQARKEYDPGTMIAEYIRTYETLNGGKPLI